MIIDFWGIAKWVADKAVKVSTAVADYATSKIDSRADGDK